jgi:hypothetical protein
MLDKSLTQVMLSSTFRNLVKHRDEARRVLKELRIHANQMEDDASVSDRDMIDNSLAMVKASAGYFCIIGKRYGQIRECRQRNPQSLSMTELEFDLAVAMGLPIAVIIMGADYPVADRDNEFDMAARAKLQAFRDRAGLPHRVVGEFNSWEEFLRILPNSVTDIRAAMDRRSAEIASPVRPAPSSTPLPSPENIVPALPPTLQIVKPFTQGHGFVGRKKELSMIDAWAAGADAVLVVEAIGGMGKSMLCHRWLEQKAPADVSRWAGRLWYSFYEEGASMNDFCVHALAYIENRAPRHFRGLRTSELQPLLTAHLNAAPWLIVMDGLERVLVAYHRYDKAQLLDGEAVGDPVKADRDPNRCVHPADDLLLQALTTVTRAKLLVSTRNMPAALVNASGGPIDGVTHEYLTGLEPDDAEQMMIEAGVRGDPTRVQTYLETNFECHPLMVGVVAGLVNTYVPAPGWFDQWLSDPQGSGAVDLSKLDGLARKRDHILKTAYEALDADERKLLGILAFFPGSVSGEVLVLLNPRRPKAPVVVSKPPPAGPCASKVVSRLFDINLKAWRDYEDASAAWRSSSEVKAADSWLGGAARVLQLRGLMIADRRAARYDLHPMVRGFVRHAMRREESAETGRAVADYARSKSPARFAAATKLGDLLRGTEIVTALTLGGHFDEAVAAFIDSGLSEALYVLDFDAARLEIIRPFFSNGWGALPDRISDVRAKLSLAHAASQSLDALNYETLADELQAVLLKSAIAGNDRYLVTYVTTFALMKSQKGAIYGARRLLSLIQTRGEGWVDDEESISARSALIRMDYLRGELALAREAQVLLEADLQSRDVQDVVLRSNVLLSSINLRFRDGVLTDSDIDEAIAVVGNWHSSNLHRYLLKLRGQLLRSRGECAAAINFIEAAIAMARETGSVDRHLEVEYAMALAQVGRSSEAAGIAARLALQTEPLSAGLAELYLAIDRPDDARRFALAGYGKAWGDGPPYALHWELAECRGVLEAVGEPEPRLPAFDPARCERYDFEDALESLLEAGQAAHKAD